MENEIFKLKNQYKAKNGIKLDRNEKRKQEKEVLHFEKEIEPFVIEFEELLFNDNVANSYQELYNTFLDGLVKICNELNRVKYKVIEVDTYFFQEYYKPLEVA